MEIKILGPGDRSCSTLEERIREALDDLAILAAVVTVTDVGKIVGYGIMRTPALVVDEHVLVIGHVPTVAQLRDLLASARIGRTGASEHAMAGGVGT